MNAPRILKPIMGDFIATVRVVDAMQPKGPSNYKDFLPYHGGGLLVWQDSDNYVRLEVAAWLDREGKIRHFLNFQARQNRELLDKGYDVPAEVNQIRLQRKGSELTPSYLDAKGKWQNLPMLKVDLTDDVEIGLVGINTAGNPLNLTFDQYDVSPIKQ
jgi:regulation of enolase protein 1 (concanavalin A-like superfamily)